MKISIITITRNNAEGLQRTIDSIGSQRHVHEVEHIVVDGESTDGTSGVLAGARTEPELISRSPRGVYDAINAGIEAATGDVIGLLHAGDTYSDRHVLDDVIATFDSHPDTDFIFGDVYFAVPGGRIARYYSGAECGPHAIVAGLQPPHPSMFIRREAQLRAGLYNADYPSAGDFEMFVRLFMVHTELQWEYLPRNMVCMQPGGVSATLYNRLWGNNRQRMRAFRENNVSSSFIRILPHYFHVLKSYLWRIPRK